MVSALRALRASPATKQPYQQQRSHYLCHMKAWKRHRATGVYDGKGKGKGSTYVGGVLRQGLDVSAQTCKADAVLLNGIATPNIVRSDVHLKTCTRYRPLSSKREGSVR